MQPIDQMNQQLAPLQNEEEEAQEQPIEQKAVNDAMGLGMMMRKMTEEVREKVFPAVKAHLTKIEPRLAEIFPGDQAPTDGGLDRVLLPPIQEAAANKLVESPLLALKYLAGEEMQSSDEETWDEFISDIPVHTKMEESRYGSYLVIKEVEDKEKFRQAVADKAQLLNLRHSFEKGAEDRRLRELKRKGETGPESQFSTKMKTKIQQRVLDTQRDVKDLEEIYEGFDMDAFTYQGKFAGKIARQMDKLGYATENQKQLLKRRISQRQKVERMMLIWRKFITGVAGGDKEMMRIESTTLNMDLSPSEAEKSLDDLMRKALRDREVNRRLLTRGLSFESQGEKAYTKHFMSERLKVEKETDEYIRKFRKVNPGASALDAIRARPQLEALRRGKQQ